MLKAVKISILFLMVVIAVTGCSVHHETLKIHSQFPDTASPELGHKFAIIPVDEVTPEQEEALIVYTAETLTAKGYTYDPDNPDFWVVVQAFSQETVEYSPIEMQVPRSSKKTVATAGRVTQSIPSVRDVRFTNVPQTPKSHPSVRLSTKFGDRTEKTLIGAWLPSDYKRVEVYFLKDAAKGEQNTVMIWNPADKTIKYVDDVTLIRKVSSESSSPDFELSVMLEEMVTAALNNLPPLPENISESGE